MKGKSEKRILAEQLRREKGYTYNEISEQVGVNKSTLSGWLKSISLTLEQERRIQKRIENNQSKFVARARQTNKKKYRNARQNAFQKGTDVAALIPDDEAIHELALAMLYLGEGDKSGSRVQIANTDPDVLKYFLITVERLYQIDRNRMSLRLNLIELARPLEPQMIDWWSKQLGCSASQFQKTQFDNRSKYKRLTSEYHGVCTATYNDTYLYERLTGVYSAYFERRLGK